MKKIGVRHLFSFKFDEKQIELLVKCENSLPNFDQYIRHKKRPNFIGLFDYILDQVSCRIAAFSFRRIMKSLRTFM